MIAAKSGTADWQHDSPPGALFYRALTPRWAHLPESGAGAAAVGGRFIHPGVEARYLAESAEGALNEYRQESPLLFPATLATYRVTADEVIDFSGWYNPEQWSPLSCPVSRVRRQVHCACTRPGSPAAAECRFVEGHLTHRTGWRLVRRRSIDNVLSSLIVDLCRHRDASVDLPW